jgi:hypothetical protein
MKIEHPTPLIVCDDCEQAEADTEEAAAAGGWLIDASTDPRTHFCPACQERALRRR